MKKVLYTCFYLLFSTQIFSQYSIDTLSSIYVGPGVIHTKILVPEIPWQVNILEIDLTNPYIQIESVKAKDKLLGYEAVSSMSARKNYEGHQVVGAINGDFYGGGGEPTNTQILKGEMLRNPIDRVIVGFDYNDKPLIDVVQYSGNVIYGSSSNPISAVNADRGNNDLILYNSYQGSSTGTNSYGTEVSVEAIDPWFVNDTIRAIVRSKALDQGNMKIDSNRTILSAHGTSRVFLNNLNIGDTIKIINKLLPALPKLKEGVGGSELIIHHGMNVGGWYERHPRTAVGFSKDSTKVYFIVVDGRTVVSAGMQLDEFGDFLLKIGNIYEAINLDGGGSSTMVVRGKVENYPSDGPGSERLVSNGLMIISTAPIGTIHGVNILPKIKKLFRGEAAAFSASAHDEFYNPVSLEPSQVQYYVDKSLGTISNDGKFTAAMSADTGYVHLICGTYTDSALVVVKDLTSFELFPENIMTDTTKTVYFGTVGYDMDNYTHQLNASEFSWNTDNPMIGIMDSLGYFHGKSEGIVKVIASYGELSDTSLVTVEIGKGVAQLDVMDSDTSWVLTGSEVDLNETKLSSNNSIKTAGNASLRIDYKFTAQSGKLNYIYLEPKKEIEIYGVPEFLYVDAKSDSVKHRLYYIVSDNNAELFRVNANKYADRMFTFDTIPCPLKSFTPLAADQNFYYPIKLKRIEIQLAGIKTAGTVNTGSVYLDNLRVKYPASDVTSVSGDKELPSGYYLQQNYPNPFNPVTIISFNIPDQSPLVQLSVFDILGREVALLVNKQMNAGSYKVEWNAAGHPSGVYFYRIDTGKFSETKKMMLMK